MSVNDLRVGKFNRTKKISDETRTLILRRYEEGHTIAEISREFSVSWTSVKCIVDPVYYQQLKDHNREYCKTYKRENYNNNMQRHRDYKRQLLKEGKI